MEIKCPGSTLQNKNCHPCSILYHLPDVHTHVGSASQVCDRAGSPCISPRKAWLKHHVRGENLNPSGGRDETINTTSHSPVSRLTEAKLH